MAINSLSGTSNRAVNDIFYENSNTVSQSYTIPNGRNAGTFGPVTIGSGVTVTVSEGAVWVIV